jgi:hypothetical protein
MGTTCLIDFELQVETQVLVRAFSGRPGGTLDFRAYNDALSSRSTGKHPVQNHQKQYEAEAGRSIIAEPRAYVVAGKGDQCHQNGEADYESQISFPFCSATRPQRLKIGISAMEHLYFDLSDGLSFAASSLFRSAI